MFLLLLLTAIIIIKPSFWRVNINDSDILEIKNLYQHLAKLKIVTTKYLRFQSIYWRIIIFVLEKNNLKKDVITVLLHLVYVLNSDQCEMRFLSWIFQKQRNFLGNLVESNLNIISTFLWLKVSGTTRIE